MRKRLFVFISALFILVVGCSTPRKTANSQNPHIVKAGYRHWSHTATQDSIITKRGTDLALIVSQLPEGAQPQTIIYNHRKSFRPEITDTTETGIVMSARIIDSASVQQNMSPKTKLSDRLIYQDRDNSTHFLQIDEWLKVQK